MPRNDIDNGRLICVVGIAPLRLVKFVIFRTGRKRRVTEALERSGFLGLNRASPN